MSNLTEHIIGILAEHIIGILEDSDFKGCEGCAFASLCQDYELVCYGCILGILNDEKWKPKIKENK